MGNEEIELVAIDQNHKAKKYDHPPRYLVVADEKCLPPLDMGCITSSDEEIIPLKRGDKEEIAEIFRIQEMGRVLKNLGF